VNARPGVPDEVHSVMSKSRYLLLDFDGPLCDIFAGLPAPQVASALKNILRSEGIELPGAIAVADDPLEVFRFSASAGARLNHAVLNALTDLEVEAVPAARPTPGAAEVLRWASESGRPVAVISNNSVAAVTRYLQDHGLMPVVDQISARAAGDPGLMKPSPYLIRQALALLDAEAAQSVVVGDSLTDIEAAKAAGTLSVGFANRPGKLKRLIDAGADGVITAMLDLIPGLSG